VVAVLLLMFLVGGWIGVVQAFIVSARNLAGPRTEDPEVDEFVKNYQGMALGKGLVISMVLALATLAYAWLVRWMF
jgi:hypothetical protein